VTITQIAFSLKNLLGAESSIKTGLIWRLPRPNMQKVHAQLVQAQKTATKARAKQHFTVI